MTNVDSDSYFLLYANCIPVKGAARSLICDLQNRKYFYIPNSLYEILEEAKNNKLIDIYNHFCEDEQKIIDEYIDYLIENNLGFIDNEPNLFPNMDLEWDEPSEVTNSVIDIDESYVSEIDYKTIFEELNHLNCKCVQLRSFNSISIDTLDFFLNNTLDSRIRDLRLVLKYDSGIEQKLDDVLLEKHKRINQVVFFNAPDNYTKNIMGVQFIYMNCPELSLKDCGQICTGNFSINIKSFTEAIHYNSCLNRKVSLDIYGNIKNCPSQRESFGNIKNTSIRDAIKNQKFQSLWKVKKDDIKICQVCEYRYICTDCRIFIQDESDQLSKPSKCTYDPYTTRWL